MPVIFYFKIDVRGGVSKRDFGLGDAKSPALVHLITFKGKNVGSDSEPHGFVLPWSFYNPAFSNLVPL